MEKLILQMGSNIAAFLATNKHINLNTTRKKKLFWSQFFCWPPENSFMPLIVVVCESVCLCVYCSTVFVCHFFNFTGLHTVICDKRVLSVFVQYTQIFYVIYNLATVCIVRKNREKVYRLTLSLPLLLSIYLCYIQAHS